MTFSVLSILFAIIAAAFGFFAFRLLLKKWFLVWLRGCCGLLFIGIVILLLVVAVDVFSYRQLQQEQNIATIQFEKIQEQKFIATFKAINSEPKKYELLGDQWQLDSRVIKWSQAAGILGVKTGYRLDRLLGRYLLLDDERNKPRNVYELNSSWVGIDTWHWLKQFDKHIPFVDARYGNAVFLPMVNRGKFQISLTNSGLIARPINNAAKEAVELWQ